MVETRLLHQFIAVAEELHFNRAAERLHMAQPPLSQAIRRLEAEIGSPLFERTNRNVTLTPAGMSFLNTARQTLDILSEGIAHTRHVAQGIEGHITMTFINIESYVPLLRALRSFRQASPNVAFTMREATTYEQVEALEAGTADIGFMRIPGATTPNLHLELIWREPIFIALPCGHPLEHSEYIDLALVKDETFVTSHRSSGQGFHDQLVRLCQLAGFSPKVTQQARQLHTLIALVASGFGIALLPASMAQEKYADIVFRPVTVDVFDDLRYIDLFMVWNVDRHSPVRDRLIEEIRRIMPFRNTFQ